METFDSSGRKKMEVRIISDGPTGRTGVERL